MILAGLISSYREGGLLEGAVRSTLAGTDYVLCIDGPTSTDEPNGWKNRHPFALPRDVFKNEKFNIHQYGSSSDAAKRTELLYWAGQRKADWVIVVDGDEVLMNPEHVRAQIERCEAEHEGSGASAVAVPLRIVEVDGSVGLTYTRILRVDAFEAYVNSSSFLRTTSGELVGASNRKLCGPGGFPVEMETLGEPSREDVERHLATCRGPVGGEPYLWHRPLWRAPDRDVERQHVAELRTWREFQGGALDPK